MSKSKNLPLYPYFFPYSDSSDVPISQLAMDLGVVAQTFVGMMRSAKNNASIFLALVDLGHDPEKIPHWFARPKGYEVIRKGTEQKKLKTPLQVEAPEPVKAKPRFIVLNPASNYYQEKHFYSPSPSWPLESENEFRARIKAIRDKQMIEDEIGDAYYTAQARMVEEQNRRARQAETNLMCFYYYLNNSRSTFNKQKVMDEILKLPEKMKTILQVARPTPPKYIEPPQLDTPDAPLLDYIDEILTLTTQIKEQNNKDIINAVQKILEIREKRRMTRLEKYPLLSPPKYSPRDLDWSIPGFQNKKY